MIHERKEIVNGSLQDLIKSKSTTKGDYRFLHKQSKACGRGNHKTCASASCNCTCHSGVKQ